MPRFKIRKGNDGRYRWFLLGGNNRLIGIGTRVRGSLGRVLDDVELVRGRASGVIEYTMDDEQAWRWHLPCGGTAIAEAHRGFPRRLDAQRAAERFRRLCGEAVVDTAALSTPHPTPVRSRLSRDPRYGAAGRRDPDGRPPGAFVSR